MRCETINTVSGRLKVTVLEYYPQGSNRGVFKCESGQVNWPGAVNLKWALLKWKFTTDRYNKVIKMSLYLFLSRFKILSTSIYRNPISK